MKIKKYLISSGLVASLVLGTWTYTQAVANDITVCVKKDGTVHVIGPDFKRDDCKKNETLLTWNAQGPKGDKGDKGSAGASLHLYDANGQDLGVLVRGQANVEQFTTYTTLDNGYSALLNFQVKDGGDSLVGIAFRELDSTELYFSQANCTGDAFMREDPDAQQIFSDTGNPNSGYFVQRLDTILADRLAKSTMLASVCSDISDSNGHRSKTVLVHQVTLPFTEPLAWPLKVQ